MGQVALSSDRSVDDSKSVLLLLWLSLATTPLDPVAANRELLAPAAGSML